MGRAGCDGFFDFLDGSCRPACNGCSDDCDREDDDSEGEGDGEDDDSEGEDEGEDDREDDDSEAEGDDCDGDSGFTRASATPSLAVSPTSPTARPSRSPADPGA
ncbi:hypothetical protein [Streptomyces luteogriseus]|uniref:hypothetical protein n=1 Tax=Streptomyces luteogriseus TaxID=68233 RepID=UPI0036B15B85